MNINSSGAKNLNGGVGGSSTRGKASDDIRSASSQEHESGEARTAPIRIILADSEAIFRVGMAKIFAAEKDLEVVAQTETLPQTLNAVGAVAADVILFETG